MSGQGQAGSGTGPFEVLLRQAVQGANPEHIRQHAETWSQTAKRLDDVGFTVGYRIPSRFRDVWEGEAADAACESYRHFGQDVCDRSVRFEQAAMAMHRGASALARAVRDLQGLPEVPPMPAPLPRYGWTVDQLGDHHLAVQAHEAAVVAREEQARQAYEDYAESMETAQGEILRAADLVLGKVDGDLGDPGARAGGGVRFTGGDALLRGYSPRVMHVAGAGIERIAAEQEEVAAQRVFRPGQDLHADGGVEHGPGIPGVGAGGHGQGPGAGFPGAVGGQGAGGGANPVAGLGMGAAALGASGAVVAGGMRAASIGGAGGTGGAGRPGGGVGGVGAGGRVGGAPGSLPPGAAGWGAPTGTGAGAGAGAGGASARGAGSGAVPGGAAVMGPGGGAGSGGAGGGRGSSLKGPTGIGTAGFGLGPEHQNRDNRRRRGSRNPHMRAGSVEGVLAEQASWPRDEQRKAVRVEDNLWLTDDGRWVDDDGYDHLTAPTV